MLRTISLLSSQQLHALDVEEAVDWLLGESEESEEEEPEEEGDDEEEETQQTHQQQQERQQQQEQLECQIAELPVVRFQRKKKRCQEQGASLQP